MTIKVTVQYNKDSKEYELNRDLPLKVQVDALCKIFNINASPVDYTLQFSSGVYFTDEQYASPEFAVPSNSTLNLKLKPDTAVDAVIKVLKESDANAKKTTLFALRETLKDEEFTKRFLAKNGVEVITHVLLDQSLLGSTIGYALTALHEAMSHQTGWENLPQSFVEKTLLLSDSSNHIIAKPALRILILVCESPKYGFASLSAACKTTAKISNKQAYASLIVLLGSTEVDIQLSTLTLINRLASQAAAGPERNSFLALLDSQEINSILKRQLGSNVPEFKKQLYTFQKHRLNTYKWARSVPYDKTNPDHEATLMRMWTATYPDTKLESRVSEQWKLLGFQGTDPATDFRGMGYLGLSQLVYFAENHTDIFRKIVNGQIARKEREYPVAVAGINLTQKLYDILKVNDESPDGPIFPVLFSHRFAFEEMYCTAFEVLDHTWDDMNASYMDFPKVIAAVHKQIVEVMDARPLSLEQFHNLLCNKGRPLVGEGSASNDEVVAITKLRTVVRKETLDMVKHQRLAYLVDGCCFRMLRGLKEKSGRNLLMQQFLYAKVSDNHQDLLWTTVADVNEKPATIPNIVKISEITSVVLGNDVPSFGGGKKKGPDDIVTLAFAFLLKDEKQNVEFLAITREDFVNWVDGMRALIGKAMECPETLEEAKILVSLEMKVRLLDLEGIDLPKDPPPIPEIPTDFDFAEFRKQPHDASTLESTV